MAAVLAPAVPRRGSANWQERAACRGADTRIFYHPDNERGPSRRRREMRAKQICRGCPVLTECLSWALATREPYGVWGGLSPEERGALLTSQLA
jgi:WhiB family transcriptional regulator, redox-sensing transcriptional regulator